MKKILLLASLWFCVVYAHAQTQYTWIVASGDLDAPGNWSPTRNAPAADDILIFDGGQTSTATVTNIPNRETIGQLVILNNCAVTFSSGVSVAGPGTVARNGTAVTGTGTSFITTFVPGDVINIGTTGNEVATVTSNTTMTTSASGTVSAGTAYTLFPRITLTGGTNAFYVDNTCSLTISAPSSISFYLVAGTTADIEGALSFTGAAHRINAASQSSVTFGSSSKFTQGTGFSGNAFTAAGVANMVTFTNGSTFTVAAGSNPFALTAPASKVVFQTGSLFVQTAGGPSFSGRTYADFELNTGNSQSVTGGSAVSVNNLVITGNSTLNWNMTGTPGHSIKGNITVGTGSTLNFAPSAAGTTNLNGTVAQSISSVSAITINANSTVVNGNTAGIVFTPGTFVTVAGTLNLGDKHVTLRSTSAGTAGIGKITGTLSGASNVTVERYIPAHAARAYTMVGFSAFGGTIYNNWQEGGSSTAGYGTQISGSSAGNGFDFASSAGISSIYNYDDPDYPPGSKWQGLPNTNNTTPSSTNNGYLLFVRGDRTVGAGSGAPSATTLRSTGGLAIGHVGPMAMFIGADVYSVVANPYACPINWSTTTKTNITGSFTVYDPNLLSFVTSDGTTVSPSASQQQANIIQAGQAFFTQNDGSGNTPGWEVNETDKNIGAATNTGSTVFSMPAPVTQLNVNFYKNDNTFADGMVAVFDNDYNKNKDAKDAAKFTNFNETISFVEKDRSLSIDARPMPVSDTLFISTKQMTAGATYKMVIDGKGFNSGNLRSATLVDKATGLTTPLDLSGENNYSFTPAAAAETGRLYIILSNTSKVAVAQNINTTNSGGLSVTLLDNPAKEEVRLQYTAKQAGNTSIRVVNMKGYAMNKVNLGMQQQGIATIPVSGYASGLYLVEVKVGNAIVIAKVVKQ